MSVAILLPLPPGVRSTCGASRRRVRSREVAPAAPGAVQGRFERGVHVDHDRPGMEVCDVFAEACCTLDACSALGANVPGAIAGPREENHLQA